MVINACRKNGMSTIWWFNFCKKNGTFAKISTLQRWKIRKQRFSPVWLVCADMCMLCIGCCYLWQCASSPYLLNISGDRRVKLRDHCKWKSYRVFKLRDHGEWISYRVERLVRVVALPGQGQKVVRFARGRVHLVFKQCTVTNNIIRAKSQKYGRFTGNFLKMLVYTGVPISIRAGVIALLLSPIYRLFFLSFCVSIFLCLFFRLSVFLFVFLSFSLSFCLSSSWFISVHLCSWEVSLMPSEACLVHSEALAEGWSS